MSSCSQTKNPSTTTPNSTQNPPTRADCSISPFQMTLIFSPNSKFSPVPHLLSTSNSLFQTDIMQVRNAVWRLLFSVNRFPLWIWSFLAQLVPKLTFANCSRFLVNVWTFPIHAFVCSRSTDGFWVILQMQDLTLISFRVTPPDSEPCFSL